MWDATLIQVQPFEAPSLLYMYTSAFIVLRMYILSYLCVSYDSQNGDSFPKQR
jgi:hypothetical protein